jgi:P27 family predicted phage terminase small subunit
MAGRPRKPKELKKLEGTYRKDRDKPMEVARFTKLINAGNPPESFDQYERAEFEFMTNALIRINVLEDVDINLVIMYCLEMGRYMRLNDDIKVNGINYYTEKGYPMLRPEFKVLNASYHNAMIAATKLGISPVDRQKLLIQNKEKPEVDPVAGIL